MKRLATAAAMAAILAPTAWGQTANERLRMAVEQRAILEHSLRDTRPVDKLPDPDYRPAVGDRAILFVQELGRVPASKDEAGLIAAVAVLAKKDLGKLPGLAEGGTITLLAPETAVLVKKVKATNRTSVQVRVEEGPSKGHLFWVDGSWVVRFQPLPGARSEFADRLGIPRSRRERGMNIVIPSEEREKMARAEQARRDREAKKKARDAEGKKKAAEPSTRAASKLAQAKALEKAKKPDAALGYYREVVRDFPGTGEAEEAGKRIEGLKPKGKP